MNCQFYISYLQVRACASKHQNPQLAIWSGTQERGRYEQMAF